MQFFNFIVQEEAQNNAKKLTTYNFSLSTIEVVVEDNYKHNKR